MPFNVAKHSCNSCHETAKIYFPEEVVPRIGEIYRYRCPGCGQIVYFRSEGQIIHVNDKESIPKNATIAEKKEFH
jgi:uncharacterized C2H2 Zn-finger protein